MCTSQDMGGRGIIKTFWHIMHCNIIQVANLFHIETIHPFRL